MNRVVVISGASGAGKSETLRAMRASLAGMVGDMAGLDSDDFYMMIDPHWTRPANRVDRYYAVSGWVLREAALGFLRSGFDWVSIASNGLWQEERVREFTEPFTRDGAQVHHVTLDPGEDVIRERGMRRAASAGLAIDERQAAEVDELQSTIRAALGPWTHVLDNSRLTPSATALAVYEAVERGDGRLDR